ncbi:MAG: hypothetical protein UY35_C0036G0010, partial [Candidatus Saccharibacteria bacterium GW2011_GWC2_48_9]
HALAGFGKGLLEQFKRTGERDRNLVNQAFELGRLAQAEWQRTQRGPCPYDGLFVGWFGRFQAAKTLPVPARGRRKEGA